MKISEMMKMKIIVMCAHIILLNVSLTTCNFSTSLYTSNVSEPLTILQSTECPNRINGVGGYEQNSGLGTFPRLQFLKDREKSSTPHHLHRSHGHQPAPTVFI